MRKHKITNFETKPQPFNAICLILQSNKFPIFIIKDLDS
jgi:hypothetical protein